MPVDLKATLIDPADPTYKPLLDNLQGNIIKAHGRMHTASLFLRFTGTPAVVKKWISDFARQYVTSTSAQIEQAKKYRNGKDGGIFGNFFLTALGYQHSQLGIMPRDRQASFNAGMKNVRIQDRLGDPPVEQWESGFQQDIHALAFLADDNEARLKATCDTVTASLNGVATVLTKEHGVRWLNDKEEDIEPFGYRDGVSQPVFLKGSTESPGETRWDPSASLELVLVEDPNVPGRDCFGSFLVFRKLEQDVRKFNEQVSKLAQALGTTADLAGAYVVGRFKDGTPVTLSDKPGTVEPRQHIDFDYEQDTEGARCPFHAHIRKTNPRGDTGRLAQPGIPLEQERRHRIARRGQPYGNPNGGAAGLLFLCFQSDISLQFEFIQSSWANGIHFVKMNGGLDGVIGQGTQVPDGPLWCKTYGSLDETIGFDFSDVIKLKGGDYFFAPSVAFLQGLGTTGSAR
ncbi:Dyp-type peroxidase [Archangium gephyra]|nr:Dyp-type peroxidase [Archangium gephyra]